MNFKQIIGLIAVVYLAAAVLFFLLAVKINGVAGGHDAIDMFFIYLPEGFRSDMADFLISLF